LYKQRRIAKEIRGDLIELDFDKDVVEVLIDRLRRSEEYLNIDEDS
jgi:hypothetical protein